jgi:hypothetical protein
MVLFRAFQANSAWRDGKDANNRDRFWALLVPSKHIVLHAYVVSTILVYTRLLQYCALAQESKVVSYPLPHIRLITRTRRRSWNGLVTQTFGLQCSSQRSRSDEGFPINFDSGSRIIDKYTGSLDRVRTSADGPPSLSHSDSSTCVLYRTVLFLVAISRRVDVVRLSPAGNKGSVFSIT